MPRSLLGSSAVLSLLLSGTVLAETDLPAGILGGYFEPNCGQASPEVRFLGRGPGYSLFLTASGLELNFPAGPPVRLRLLGTLPNPSVEGAGRSPGVSNYFIGNDPRLWQTGVPHFARVLYREVYRGIDLVFYTRNREVEYDFLLSADADPDDIQLVWEGVSSLRRDAAGDLLLNTSSGTVRQRRPRVYQIVDGRQVEVSSAYRILPEGRITFALARYDRRLPLTIDPVISYATFLGGGANDRIAGIAVDSTGNAYVTGETNSANFPAARLPGARLPPVIRAFVAKFNANGSALVYATFLGGSISDSGAAIAVDSSGSVTVTGAAVSPDFPTTAGAYDRSHNGQEDAFVARLNAAGNALVYATFLGGRETDRGRAVALDAAGNAVVAGVSGGANFPTTPNSLQTIPRRQDAFAAKLNAAGSALLYSTFLSGSYEDDAYGIALDPIGNAYICGVTYSPDFPTTPEASDRTYNGQGDGFVVKLNAAGSGLHYGSYLGGSRFDVLRAIAVDAVGRAYAGGMTDSPDFPLTPTAFDRTSAPSHATVSRFTTTGGLSYSTFLGGERSLTLAVQVHPSGHFFAAGRRGRDFPSTPGSLPGAGPAFLAQFHATGSRLLYSASFGGLAGHASALALDTAANAYVAGEVTRGPVAGRGTAFPSFPFAYDSSHNGALDAFLARFTGFDAPTPCGITPDPPPPPFAAYGGFGYVSVTAPYNCSWAGIPGAGWISPQPPPEGSGVGTFSYTVAANTQPLARAAAIAVASSAVHLLQSGSQPSAPFADVPAGHPLADVVSLLKRSNITRGCSDTSFCPGAPVTRSQLAVFAVRGAFATDNFPYSPTPYFDDVPASHPHFRWVQKAREMQLMGPCPGGGNRFCDETSATRAEAAGAMARARLGVGFSASSQPYFGDVPPGHPEFAAIQILRQLGITSGCTLSAFCPEQPLERGQIATFLVRAFLASW